MPLMRSIRKLGNSLAFPVPNEVFEFLDFDPKTVKYKLSQDETGNIYLIILGSDVFALDEKKFQKNANIFCFILPKPLCELWNIGTGEGQKRKLKISYANSPRKWLLSPCI